MVEEHQRPVPCPPAGIRVLVATRSRPLRKALMRTMSNSKRLHALEVEPAATGELKLPSASEAGILLLGSSGLLRQDLQTICRVRVSSPRVRILLLASSNDEAAFLQCVRSGIAGYLLQDASGEEVLKAIQAIAAGVAVCPASLFGALLRNLASGALPFTQVERAPR
jgi:DNA-binding NarL/FixJ family response regulator